ncbi:hypothetical protein K1719_028350 [Acacia pycnantha]|nr:hypothetical protein K1719_028350 [Acacia pycnantha]
MLETREDKLEQCPTAKTSGTSGLGTSSISFLFFDRSSILPDSASPSSHRNLFELNSQQQEKIKVNHSSKL